MRISEERVSQIVDADSACRILHDAAELLREDPNRSGSLLSFGNAGQLVVTGDMHGHLRNYEKLQRFCALQNNPGRSVILHELIHGEPENPGDPDLSIDLLIRAAQWKCDFPDNVFMLQSNHELSQLCRHEITKGGRSVIRDFERGVEERFGKRASGVLAAVDNYIRALPLAARTASGIFIAHSLPDPLSMEIFDEKIFEREPTERDMLAGGALYSLVWGRFHSPEAVEYFARRLSAKLFITGHMPQEMGYDVIGRMLILASDHAHGSFLPINLAREYTIEELEKAVHKFVAVE
ncbi:MAG: metallophosphoesterase [Planctomycetota bacterium]